MKIITWNCQGAASKRFLRAAMTIIRQHKPNCFCVLEPKSSGTGADETCIKLGFDQWLRVEAVGMSGGIWILWNDSLSLHNIRTNPQFVSMEIKNNNSRTWNIAVVYGSPSHSLRRNLWLELGREQCGLNEAWVTLGDFNSVKSSTEVNCPDNFNMRRSKDFTDWISRESLIDLGFRGSQFTWRRGTTVGTFKAARLDRCLCTEAWLDIYPEAAVTHLSNFSSDHNPILLTLVDRIENAMPRRFQYQAMWGLHADFGDVVNNTWNTTSGADFDDRLQATQVALKTWSKAAIGNLERKRRQIMARIDGIQRAKNYGKRGGLIKLEAKLKIELDDILHMEELAWFQRSREDWIALDQVTQMVQDHFRDFFMSATTSNNERKVTSDEVKIALFEMAPYKAPGPDGFHAAFYQRMWSVIGMDLTDKILEFFQTAKMHNHWNDTLIALIPKVHHPELITQFRPISLCNVKYKIVTKVITNRLKSLMTQVVGEEQSSFVPQRQITDNIVVYQELLHTMRTKRSGLKAMTLKIDLEKAYDRISWDFLQDTLYGLGMERHWVNIIMECVTTPKLAILWKGSQLDWITPTRGLRQGDPISPYLFVLCMERLSRLIKEEVHKKNWKGVKLSRYGPELTHLFFADDMVLIAEASLEQMKVIKGCLQKFEKASGQKVSIQKSQIHFGRNVEPALAQDITREADFVCTKDLGRYLGVPSIHGRVTSNIFTPLIEKIDGRLEGWKGKNLSLAGRITLAQSVLNAMPYYMMQSMYLPKGVCDTIERRIRQFIWKENIHLVNWETITKPKEQGGVGLRRLREMNLAFLTKLGWRLHTEKENLWAKVVLAKYMHGTSEDCNYTKKKACSNLWRGICEAQPILSEGTSRQTQMEGMFWKLEPNGHCSVTSAYRLALKTDKGDDDNTWKVIWSLKVPRRINSFLWLLRHKKLMTNVERKRRGFTIDARCINCHAYEEDVLHCLRDCAAAKEIWEVFLPSGAQRWFFRLNVDTWFTRNVTGKLVENKEGNWKSMFAIIAWWIWNWRCKKTFNEDSWSLTRRIDWIKEQVESTTRAFLRQKLHIRTKMDVAGNRPITQAWTLLNTDASFSPGSSMTGCGGVLRDHGGHWIKGFSCMMKTSNSTEAELWAIYLGLKWTWDQGIRSIYLRTDSQQAVTWLNGHSNILGHCDTLVKWCKEWLRKDWTVIIDYVPREKNGVADWLAKEAPRRKCEWVDFHCPPREVGDMMSMDTVSHVLGH
ncbi:PREDICTED: uncharacterized protein LOC109160503 [Ipomoea nil]|uniref:uncharacterized protein LOC109160503 n=1 Tax=Ipomoea nil TaxID=35883 RepID=UPI000900AAAC|nr:PREDICTED: uncharacterized protein LOC109160503 [Ipomoea nil]